MKVRATQKGYYGGALRRPGTEKEPGDEFEIADESHFSKKWMEKIEEKAVAEQGQDPIPVKAGPSLTPKLGISPKSRGRPPKKDKTDGKT